MTQYDLPTIDSTPGTGTSGAQLATYLNSWKAAVLSNQAGAARPAGAVASQIWVKTVSGTAHEVYYFDGTDDILICTVNPTTNTVSLNALYDIQSNPGNATLNPTGSPADGMSYDRATARLILSRTANPALTIVKHGSDGSCTFFVRNNAVVGSINVTTTATTYATSSDYRLKYDVVNIGFTFDDNEDIAGPLGKLMRLKPSKYHMYADNGAAWHYGFIAHELQTEAPEAVTGEKDATEWATVPVGTMEDPEGGPPLVVTEMQEVPIYQSVDTSQLVTLLVASIQQLTRRVMELETNAPSS
jgi:hypothetical protein